MIKRVYEAVRNGRQWEETLLLITYDEHGGFYDHFPPTKGKKEKKFMNLGLLRLTFSPLVICFNKEVRTHTILI